MKIKIITLVVLVLLAACDQKAQRSPESSSAVAELPNEKPSNETSCNNTVNVENWPKQESVFARDPGVEDAVDKLLAIMTLEEKVGQVIQPDIASITPAEAKQYHVGSILNGGNSAPNNDVRATPEAWLALADEFWLASLDKSDGGAGIPLFWGTDAVHGHNNIVGATIFPHNIGLGAANDSDLVRRIAAATAKEIRVTGMDWTFAPTVAVVRNDRWGRTYESYSENPDIVAQYSEAYVMGMQGAVKSNAFLGKDHVLATVKHFVGDGGTKNGVDQGDTQVSESELRDIHAAGYPTAIRAGALVAMASFNSWCGKKLHGFKPMLTDVLRDRMGFDGFVVGDWNGHAQVDGCSKSSCAAAFNAGLDMYMAPDEWKGLYTNLLAQVKSGEISQARLDEAVKRILRVKFQAGIMSAKKPSERKYAGDTSILGAEEHRAIAREAVRKSLVLLKNNASLLPLPPQQKVLVAGVAADDIGTQSGGWTLSWQGDGNDNSHFPNGQSIYGGIKGAVQAAGGSVSYSPGGEFEERPDVAIVVFGELPYAEFRGDVPHLDFASTEGLVLLKKFQNLGIPTVSVFLSGRPMWVNPEINASSAFVAAWLPGSEGGGVADLLFRKADGSVNYDFVGRLSFSWPKSGNDAELNVGDDAYAPLFAYGYGLSVSDSVIVDRLSEDPGVTESQSQIRLLAAGDAVSPWRLFLDDNNGKPVAVDGAKAESEASVLMLEAADDKAQEDTSLLTWGGEASVYLSGEVVDATRFADGGYVMQIRYRVLGDSVGATKLAVTCGDNCMGQLDVTDDLRAQLNKGWQMSELSLSCFKDLGVDFSKVDKPFIIFSNAGTQLQISEVSLFERAVSVSCNLR